MENIHMQKITVRANVRASITRGVAATKDETVIAINLSELTPEQRAELVLELRMPPHFDNRPHYPIELPEPTQAGLVEVLDRRIRLRAESAADRELRLREVIRKTQDNPALWWDSCFGQRTFSVYDFDGDRPEIKWDPIRLDEMPSDIQETAAKALESARAEYERQETAGRVAREEAEERAKAEKQRICDEMIRNACLRLTASEEQRMYAGLLEWDEVWIRMRDEKRDEILAALGPGWTAEMSMSEYSVAEKVGPYQWELRGEVREALGRAGLPVERRLHCHAYSHGIVIETETAVGEPIWVMVEKESADDED